MSKDVNPKSSITISDIKKDIEEVKCFFKSTDNNPFPLRVLPPEIQKIVESTNQCLGFPIDYIAASLLYAASVAVGATYTVQIMKGWIESGVLYMAIVGRAGINKSHPLSWAIKPIMKRDDQSFKIYKEKLKFYEEAINMTKKDREEIGLDEPSEKPRWIKSLMTDYTPEALVDVHYHNKRGIAIYVDELASWFKSFGRYTKSAEQEFWLSTWSNKPITVDRKGSEPSRISYPYISVIGTMQPSVLGELSSDNRESNGFLDRILFVMNDSISRNCWPDKQLPNEIPILWESIIHSLFNYQFDTGHEDHSKSRVLKLTSEADKIIREWNKTKTNESNDLDNESISSIYAKMDTYCIRFALILEVLNSAIKGEEPEAINVGSVKGAIDLVAYFEHTALQVRSIIDKTVDPVDKLPDDKRSLYDGLPREFETSEAVAIGEDLKIPERNIKRLLNDKELFKKLRRGLYRKLA